MKEKRVMAFGTFDLLHKGHLYYLKHASKYGKLIVIVARDRNVEKVKGRKPLNGEKTRLKNIAKLRFVSEAMLGSLTNKYRIIEKIRPDIVCLGYDQKISVADLKARLKAGKFRTKIIRIKAFKPQIYKSSKLKLQNLSKKIFINAFPL